MREPILTKREVAKELKCSVRTVERLGLPCIRVGGQNRYYWSEVEAAIEGKSRPKATLVPLPTRGEAA